MKIPSALTAVSFRLAAFAVTFVVVFAIAAVYSIAAAEETTSATYTFDPDAEWSGVNYLQTNVPTASEDGLDVNAFVGVDRFYAAGITGQGAIIANVEAGHIWDGHETLLHVSELYTPTGARGDYDKHATWVGMMFGGRTDGVPEQNQGVHNTGIAMDADLRSGAIASRWVGDPYATSFSFYSSSVFSAYRHYFGTADVVNSSFGNADDTGTLLFSMCVDAFAYTCPTTTMVCAVGNEFTVTGPASGYNAISVGALGNANSYDSVVYYSGRGPMDYKDPSGTVYGVRASVDICAPGTSLVSAYYGGTTGGNTGGTDPTGGNNDAYSYGIQGTSFSAPIVAGGVALLASASKLNGWDETSRDGRVIKAVILNSASKTTGWDNGQTSVDGVVTTTQSLDWSLGAGVLNLDQAYDQYLSGDANLDGLSGGIVENIGWDYASLDAIGDANDYVIDACIEGDAFLDVTLTWFRDRTVSGTTTYDNAFADFDLEIWDANFETLLAASISDYNSVEHLHFLLPESGFYGIRVVYDEQRFGEVDQEYYGLAWSAAAAVPEPGQIFLLAGAVVVWLIRRRLGY